MWIRKLLPVCLCLCFSITSSVAHIHDRPDLNAWASHLEARKKGLCCDGNDVMRIDAIDWKIRDSSTVCEPLRNEHTEYPWQYCVHMEGQWWRVPDDALVDGPNKYGPAMLWPIMNTKGGGVLGDPELGGIRCFLPGAET